MLQTKVVEKLETYILCSVTIYRKSCRLCDVLKCYRAGQATDDNMAHRIACWIPKAKIHTEVV